MEIVKTIQQVRNQVQQARNEGKHIGLVPTMGALHAGHGSLIKQAVDECDFVVVSIFVNPTQFGPQEDLKTYPQNLESDTEYCRKLKANLIFAPSDNEMYPDQQVAWVDVEEISEGLCGAQRPGHFRGVATVCAKLFNIVQPDIAYFGQKDAQQVVVIKRMAADLNMPLEIRVCPIIREPDGLAMSSRNQYLSAEERKKATCLSQSLCAVKEQVDHGKRDCKFLLEMINRTISAVDGSSLEYAKIVDPDTLKDLEVIDQKALIAIAIKFGNTRLIDNLLIDLNQDRVWL